MKRNISIKYYTNMNRCKESSFEASTSFGIKVCISLTNAVTPETDRERERERLAQFNVGPWHYVRPYSLEANSTFSLRPAV
jgi:hypothetical protein